MERDTSNHPTAAQIASGEPLSEAQLASLTPEQRERLTSGEPLPVDPRSPMLDQADDIRAGRVVVDQWGPHPTESPEVVAADTLTVAGAPIDPNAGGDHDGDGRTAPAEFGGGNAPARQGLLLDDADPDDNA